MNGWVKSQHLRHTVIGGEKGWVPTLVVGERGPGMRDRPASEQTVTRQIAEHDKGQLGREKLDMRLIARRSVGCFSCPISEGARPTDG